MQRRQPQQQQQRSSSSGRLDRSAACRLCCIDRQACCASASWHVRFVRIVAYIKRAMGTTASWLTTQHTAAHAAHLTTLAHHQVAAAGLFYGLATARARLCVGIQPRPGLTVVIGFIMPLLPHRTCARAATVVAAATAAVATAVATVAQKQSSQPQSQQWRWNPMAAQADQGIMAGSSQGWQRLNGAEERCDSSSTAPHVVMHRTCVACCRSGSRMTPHRDSLPPCRGPRRPQ